MEKLSFPEQWLQVLEKFSLDFFVIEMGSQIKVRYRGGKASSYFGYPVEVFVSQIEGSFGDFILESDRAHVAKTIHEAIEYKSDIDVQFAIVLFDLSVSLIHVTGSFLYEIEGNPIYLFLISDEKKSVVPVNTQLECFKLSFSLKTGSLIDINLQGRIAFLTHEFSNIYNAITIFATRYVHPQDRKAFAVFSDERVLRKFIQSHGEQQEIPFRRTSYNELFFGYTWSLLSYSVKERDAFSGLVCEVHIHDTDKTASKLAEKTLQTQLDPLTGVLNRLALETQVNQEIALCTTKDCMGAFFMLDIDRFKLVNDTYGHDRGDSVLRQVAQAVRGVFRPSDIIARPGGDEFAVFITGIPSNELAMTKAENMCRALRSIGKPEEELALSCSVGVSMFPEDGTSFSELYHTSDIALYQAKRKGRDQYCLYGAHSIPFAAEKPIDREWLFSQLEEEIYLCNVDTYALLFVNDALLRSLGLTSLTAKGKCYEVLHGRISPCVDCKNLYEEEDQVCTRIRKETDSNSLFLVREKGLLLQGARVKLSVTTAIPQAWMAFLLEHISTATLESLPWW